MKGLILKDLINLKNQGKFYLLLISIWILCSVLNNADGFGAFFFSGLISMFPLVVVLTSISYDEKTKWNGYSLTMPISRKDIVFSKYILGLITYGVGFLLSIIINIITSKDLLQSLKSCFDISTFGLILLSLVIPLLFKFGTDKSRIIIMIFIVIPCCTMPYMSEKVYNVSDAQFEKVFSFVPFVAIAFIIVSYLISIKIMDKKEF